MYNKSVNKMTKENTKRRNKKGNGTRQQVEE
jgi:hypothetical protein